MLVQKRKPMCKDSFKWKWFHYMPNFEFSQLHLFTKKHQMHDSYVNKVIENIHKPLYMNNKPRE